MADYKVQIQALTTQVTQLNTNVKQLENKIDKLTALVKNTSVLTPTPPSASTFSSPNRKSMPPLQNTSGVNVVKPKNEIANVSPIMRPKVQTMSVSPFKEDKQEKAAETPASAVGAARKMFEGLSSVNNKNMSNINRGLSKSTIELSKEEPRSRKSTAQPALSIEILNTSSNLNKSFDGGRTPLPVDNSPVPPPLPPADEETGKLPSFLKGDRKISSATEVKRNQMMEQLKATIGERKVE